ncbi:hypothetical protein CDL12_02457 [Handroanthus impetiginosus]|uniref:Uncharacterized protein n=1 Tax=Handroanthus impetiginosus TaxID=429701 RepID=A0A2G9I4W9_9LAMI|nr:hypothetical protein CDL12_02457 [Handroanthus impetiginosus]
MDLLCFKHLRSSALLLNSLACKFVIFFVIALVFRSVYLPRLSSSGSIEQSNIFPVTVHSGKSKFVEVPQIIWGLNNQKIAFARAYGLLMPII